MTDEREYMDKRWVALALLCMAQFMVVLDASIVNVALPTIGRDLQVDQDNLSWVVNAYVLTFGGFLLLGGRLADLLGRRRIFITGLLLFAAASLAGGFAESEGVADRGARRAGPRRRVALSRCALDRHHDLQGRLRAEQGARHLGRGRWLRRRRRRAPGRRAHRVRRLGMGPVGERPDRDRRCSARTAAHPREPVRRAESHLRHPWRGHRDRRPGALRLRAGRGARRRLGLGGDARHDRRRARPPGSVRGDRAPLARAPGPVPASSACRTLTGANVVGLLTGASLFSMFFFISLYMQNVLGYSAIKAGLSYLPLAVTIILAAGIASQLVTKVGFKPVMATGMAFVAAGLAWFSQISVDGSYVGDVLFPSLLAAVGLGFSFVPVTIAAMSGVEDREAGLASGPHQHLAAGRRRARPRDPVVDRLLEDRRPGGAGRNGTRGTHRGLRGRVHGWRGDRDPRRHRGAHPDP